MNDVEFIDIDKMIKESSPLSSSEQALYQSLKKMVSLNESLLNNETKENKEYINSILKCIKEDNREEIYNECTVDKYKLILITADVKRSLKNIDDSLNMYEDASDETEKQDWLDIIKVEINETNFMLDQYKKMTVTKIEKEETPKKHLVFLKTKSKNSYYERDLKSIREEKYSILLDMFNGMRDASFTNNNVFDKSLSPNNIVYKGCWEKKENGIRIQYYKMPNDVLLIAMMEEKESSVLIPDLRERLVKNSKQVQDLRKIFKENGEPAQLLIEEGKKDFNSLKETLTINARKKNCR